MKTHQSLIIICFITFFTSIASHAFASDLDEIRKQGKLRHLGVPYANFITGVGDGLEVEMIKRFAAELGVKYEFVKTDWKSIIPDLTGSTTDKAGNGKEKRPIRGDIIATGFTILPSRQKLVNFSSPTFPTQVWFVTGSKSSISPIVPAGKLEKDILATKSKLGNITVLGKAGTCLDPKLYDIAKCGAAVKLFKGSLNDLAPAILKNEADGTLLDVPDVLVAMQKWPGKIKIIGPVSQKQDMGCAFRKSSPELRKAFQIFLKKSKEDGTYRKLVAKYYPGVFSFYPDFFPPKKKN